MAIFQFKMKIHLLIIFLPIVFAAKKIFSINHIENCANEKGKLPILINFKANNTNIPNTIFFSGNLEVVEKVPGPLEVSFEVNRCDLKAEKCERYNGMKVSKIKLVKCEFWDIFLFFNEFKSLQRSANFWITKMDFSRKFLMPSNHD